jgi:protoporphyrinogen oxidase
VPFSRVSEPKNYRANPDDPTDRTVLCAEIPCSVGDAVWDGSEADLGTLVADGLTRVGLTPGPVAEVVVRRVPRAYPVYRFGFEADFAPLDDWAAASGVLTLGRQGLFAHDNTHHALYMAYAAAECFKGGQWDAEAWRRYREVFATHVVED